MSEKRVNIPHVGWVPEINGNGPFHDIRLTDRQIELVRANNIEVEVIGDHVEPTQEAEPEAPPAPAPAPVTPPPPTAGAGLSGPLVTIGDDEVELTADYIDGIKSKAVAMTIANALGVDLGIDVTKDSDVKSTKIDVMKDAIKAWLVEFNAE